ncbi:DUF4352 domain-containing protein [Streptomyces sp. NPDC058391]|uniref:DUF4352 domain-containing protein n=1 Tax=Streptomyces sp. NPDC058391 TaxID=3346476 RepID=UPI003647A972
MSYQQPQQPSWGPQQPGWGPQPPAPKKSSAGKIVGFSCLGIVGLFVLIGVLAALVGGGDEDTSSRGSNPAATQDAAAKPDKAGDAKADDAKADDAKEEPAPDAPVKVVAKKTPFKAGILADGTDYTSVQVTITNDSDKEISVNPLYFTITDTNGSKHAAELAADENQIDTVDLAPGENVTGTVTGKGDFTPKYVTYTDGLIGDSVRGYVS